MADPRVGLGAELFAPKRRFILADVVSFVLCVISWVQSSLLVLVVISAWQTQRRRLQRARPEFCCIQVPVVTNTTAYYCNLDVCWRIAWLVECCLVVPGDPVLCNITFLGSNVTGASRLDGGSNAWILGIVSKGSYIRSLRSG